MRLPDPFTPNLKVDLLPDITQPPRILSDLTAQLSRHTNLMQPLDSYLTKRSPASFLPTIRQALMLQQTSNKRPGTKYNIPLINSLVLYVGCQGIAKLQSKGMANQFQDNACMDVFEVPFVFRERVVLCFLVVSGQLRFDFLVVVDIY